MNSGATEFPAHDTITACAIGPALAPASIADLMRAVLDSATECAEMVEADYIEHPDDDGCMLRDLRAREAKQAALQLADVLRRLPESTLNAKRARGML